MFFVAKGITKGEYLELIGGKCVVRKIKKVLAIKVYLISMRHS